MKKLATGQKLMQLLVSIVLAFLYKKHKITVNSTIAIKSMMSLSKIFFLIEKKFTKSLENSRSLHQNTSSMKL
jgi:hypothetical protein